MKRFSYLRILLFIVTAMITNANAQNIVSREKFPTSLNLILSVRSTAHLQVLLFWNNVNNLGGQLIAKSAFIRNSEILNQRFNACLPTALASALTLSTTAKSRQWPPVLTTYR